MKNILIYTIIIIISLIFKFNYLLTIATLSLPLLINLLLSLNNKKRDKIRTNYIFPILLIIITIIFYIINKTDIKEIIYITLLFIYYLLTDLKLELDNTYIYTKTIIIKKVLLDPSKYVKKYNKAKINIILITDNKYKYFKQVNSLNEEYLYKNISISKLNTKNLDIDEYLILENDKDIEKIYNDIRISRSKLDNLNRANNIKNMLIISTLLNIIILSIFKYPIPYSIKILTIIIPFYLLISITSLYLPYDTDIMNRLPLIKTNKTYYQNIMINTINTLSLTMASTLLYMYLSAMSITSDVTTTYFIISLSISGLLTILYLYSEKLTIINFIKSFTKIPSIIIYIIYLFINLLLIDIKLYWNNILITIILSLVLILWQDIIKILRLLSTRKKD